MQRLMLSLGFMVGLVSVAQAAELRYELVELGRFLPWAINDLGAMTGVLAPELPPECLCEDEPTCDPPSHCSSFWSLPAYHTCDGVVIPLSSLDGRGAAINRHNEIVFLQDEGELGNQAWGPYFWSPSTEPLPMTPMAGVGTDILRLNDAGQASGSLSISNNSACPARWATPQSEPECLVPPQPNTLGWGFGQNTEGVIVGSLQGQTNGPFRWALDDGAQIIGDPDEVFIAINNHGVILGWSGTLYHPDGSQSVVPGLPDCTTPLRDANPLALDLNDRLLALDLNDHLQVVGVSGCPDGNHAWVWSPRTGTVDLTEAVGDPNWRLKFPRRINNFGQIVVDAFRLDDPANRGGVMVGPALGHRAARLACALSNLHTRR